MCRPCLRSVATYEGMGVVAEGPSADDVPVRFVLAELAQHLRSLTNSSEDGGLIEL